MSNEHFDKQIKQKLESVQPVFEEAAWKKFRAALPVPWYVQLFQTAGGWIFGGIASLALLGTLYSFYQQKQENQSLNEEIVTLKEHSTQTLSQQIDTVVVEKWRVDTVYITKVIRERVEVPSQNYVVSNVRQQGTTRQSSVGVGKTENTLTNERTKNLTNEEVASSVRPTSQQETPEEAAKRGVLPTTEKEGNVFREKPVSEKDKVEYENQVPVSELFIPERKEDVKEQKSETQAKAKKAFKLPYVHTRVGLGFDYIGLSTPSFGPTLEAFLVKNLSINTGLLIGKARTIEHEKPKDFNKATGKRFEDEYKKFIPQRQGIEDIVIKTSFVKLPLGLTYYLPTKGNFSFLVSAGTKLDISVYQDIEFESTMQGEKLKDQFEVRPKPQVFNSFNYGMGVQYKYKHVLWQLSPYFDFHFRENPYFKNPRSFGINTSIKYDFGR